MFKLYIFSNLKILCKRLEKQYAVFLRIPLKKERFALDVIIMLTLSAAILLFIKPQSCCGHLYQVHLEVVQCNYAKYLLDLYISSHLMIRR